MNRQIQSHTDKYTREVITQRKRKFFNKNKNNSSCTRLVNQVLIVVERASARKIVGFFKFHGFLQILKWHVRDEAFSCVCSRLNFKVHLIHICERDKLSSYVRASVIDCICSEFKINFFLSLYHSSDMLKMK